MTNEEKAKRITDRIFESGFNTNRTYYDMAKNSAMDMAEWKDKQFKEFLEKVREMIRNSENPQIEPLINAMIEWIKK